MVHVVLSSFWSLAACLCFGQQQACDEPIGREPFGPELTADGLSRLEASSQNPKKNRVLQITCGTQS
jgi:hypothetical protein